LHHIAHQSFATIERGTVQDLVKVHGERRVHEALTDVGPRIAKAKAKDPRKTYGVGYLIRTLKGMLAERGPWQPRPAIATVTATASGPATPPARPEAPRPPGEAWLDEVRLAGFEARRDEFGAVVLVDPSPPAMPGPLEGYRESQLRVIARQRGDFLRGLDRIRPEVAALLGAGS
jgi:hypothetical protein